MSLDTFNPETAENLPECSQLTLAQLSLDGADIEKQWAVKSFHHAETYFKLLTSVPPNRLKLTPIDDEIYLHFRSEFPTLDVGNIDEMTDFKCETAKAKWRPFIQLYESKVQDYNFGTLLRNRPGEDYGPNNCFF
eukprot:jgi/Hompol1/2152/HPOL_002050-RA